MKAFKDGEAKVIGNLLPAATFSLIDTYAPARKMLGMAITLTT